MATVVLPRLKAAEAAETTQDLLVSGGALVAIASQPVGTRRKEDRTVTKAGHLRRSIELPLLRSEHI